MSATIADPVSKYTWASPSSPENSAPNDIPLSSPAPRNTTATTDHAHAASVPIDTRVSMVVEPCRRFTSAARWNGQPPHKMTGVPSASASHAHPVNCSAGTIDSTSSGTLSAMATARRGRSVRNSAASGSSGSASGTE